MNNYLIESKKLSLDMRGKSILKDVSFKVEAGEFLSIIGPNGSGKSSLIKILIGIFQKNSGDLFIQGKKQESFQQRELATLMSYVPQCLNHDIYYSVKEFLSLGRYVYNGKISDDTIDQAIKLTGIDHLYFRKMNTLSGGEKQMVLIASAIVQETPIMILDEPTTFLDPNYIEKVCHITHKLNKEFGKAIIQVTHNLNEALLYSDNVLALKDGRIFFMGNPRKLLSSNLLNRLYRMDFLTVEHPKRKMEVIVSKGPYDI